MVFFGSKGQSGSDNSFMAQNDEEIEVGPDSFLPLHAQDALRMYGDSNGNGSGRAMHRTSSQTSISSGNVSNNTSGYSQNSGFASSNYNISGYSQNNAASDADTSIYSHDSGYEGDTSYTMETSMDVPNTSFAPAQEEPEDISLAHHSLPSPEEAANHVATNTIKPMAVQTAASEPSSDKDDDSEIFTDNHVKKPLKTSYSCWQTRRRLIISFICLLIVIASVVVGVLLGTKDDGTGRIEGNAVVIDPDNPNDSPPTASPVPSDDDFPYFPPGGGGGGENGPGETPEPLDPTNYCPLNTEMDGIPITNFNNSVVLHGATLNATLIGVNNNPNATQPLPVCSDINAYGRGLWYTIRGPGAVVTATTCRSMGLTWGGSDGSRPGRQPLDTQLTVFSAQSTRCTDGLQCVASNDDASCGVQSTVSWYAEEGRSYYIFVSGKPQVSDGQQLSDGEDSNGELPPEDLTEEIEHPVGTFVLTLSLAPIGTCDAAIDYESEAEPISTNIMDPSQQTQVPTSSSMIVGSLLGAKIGIDPCAPGEWLGRGGEIWYRATGTGGWLMVTTCHEASMNANEFPPRLALYKGDCDQLECGLAKASEMAPSVDRDCGFGFSLNWWSELGVEYYIMVYKTNFLPGIQFGLTVEDLNPPSNGNCTGAIRLSTDGTVTYGSTLRATYTPDQVAPTCAGDQDVSHSHPGLWYQVVGNGQRLTASVCNEVTKFDTKISVFEGSCGSLTCVNANDQWCGYQSSVDWESNDGTVYYILVHGSTGGTQPSMGEFGLAVYEFLPSANDFCSDAITLEPGTVTRGSTSTASPDDYIEACDHTGGSTSNQAPGGKKTDRITWTAKNDVKVDLTFCNHPNF